MAGLVASDASSVGRPKSPTKAGKRTGAGSPMGDCGVMLKMMRPKMPERRKTRRAKSMPAAAGSFPFVPSSAMRHFSVPIMMATTARRTQTMMLLRAV